MSSNIHASNVWHFLIRSLAAGIGSSLRSQKQSSNFRAWSYDPWLACAFSSVLSVRTCYAAMGNRYLWVSVCTVFENIRIKSTWQSYLTCFIMLHHASLYFSVQGMTTQSHPFVFTAADRNHLTCSWHLQIRVPSRYQCGIVLANMANPTGTIWNSDCFSMFLSVNCFWLHCAAEINFLHLPATKKGFRWFSSYKMFDDVCAFCSPKHGFPWLQQQQPTGLGSNKWPHGCICRVAKCNLAACRMKCIERLEILM